MFYDILLSMSAPKLQIGGHDRTNILRHFYDKPCSHDHIMIELEIAKLKKCFVVSFRYSCEVNCYRRLLF